MTHRIRFTHYVIVVMMILWIGLGVNLDNEYVAELFEMFHNGDLSASDLMMDLDIGGFDGDMLDFL